MKVRLNFDSNAINAGAEKIYEILKRELSSKWEIIPVGTNGLCYADPQIEVEHPELPLVSFGLLNEKNLPFLLRDFFYKKILPQKDFYLHGGCIIGGRTFGRNTEGKINYILVTDTSLDGEKENEKKIILEELKKIFGEGSFAWALDFGFYGKGYALQIFPNGNIYAGFSFSLLLEVLKNLKEQILPPVEYQIIQTEKLRLVSKNCGLISPESFSQAEAFGAYQALKYVLKNLSPEDLISEVSLSGLRGRGGAGYPTGLKWKYTREEKNFPKYVICNADEGDPGAFMDRSLLESDPHRVLEGLILAGYAIGAEKGYFYIRAEYPLATQRIRQAVKEAKEAGYLGKNILGTNFSFEVKVRLGAGAYVCGEETALIASLEGKRGSPVPRPPYPSQRGLYGKPTCINNVETLATIPEIVLRGGKFFSQIGKEKSLGTKIFAVSGKIAKTQLVEIPMGLPLKSLIYDICGGLPRGRMLKAVQTGGPSGGFVPSSHIDIPLTYEDFLQIGSIIGSGGMIVLDETVNLAEFMLFYLNFNVDESCGKCAPCRIGGFQLRNLYENLLKGKGSFELLSQIRQIAHAMKLASLCGLGKAAPTPIFSSLKFFPEDYEVWLRKS